MPPRLSRPGRSCAPLARTRPDVVTTTNSARCRSAMSRTARRAIDPERSLGIDIGYLSATSLASDCLLAVTAVLRLQQLAEGVSVELSLAEDRGERPSGQRAVHGHDHGATVCVAQLRVRAALADILESRPA